mmetsp:Transcript_61341/g.143598  ORF Transcript_61341/g.143598 Transcript_61341/m.143598 type:complete len:220 (-) Transcript_61341:167-826(-)
MSKAMLSSSVAPTAEVAPPEMPADMPTCTLAACAAAAARATDAETASCPPDLLRVPEPRTSRIMTCAIATASADPVMRTMHGSRPLSKSILAPLRSWISLICRPPGPIKRPVALGGISMVAADSASWVRSRPSRTSVTNVFASCTFSDSPAKRTRHRSGWRSMSILAPLRSCSSWMRAPPAPMIRPTALRGISKYSPLPESVGGVMMALIMALATSTWL